MDTILRFERKDEGSIPSGGTSKEFASDLGSPRFARRSWRGDIDNSSLVLYSENSSNIFCRLRRQRYVCLIGAARPQAGSPRSLEKLPKNRKNIVSNHILGKEKILIMNFK